MEGRKLLFEKGYAKAVELLTSCRTNDGFIASRQDHDNYRRIWGRDGAIITLAALLTGKKELIDCGHRTLLTLAEHQGPHGEIPSNVDPQTKRVSYGGTAGRVDSNLWFIIAAAEYWQRTDDRTFSGISIRPWKKHVFCWGPGSITTAICCMCRLPAIGPTNTCITVMYFTTSFSTCRPCDPCAPSMPPGTAAKTIICCRRSAGSNISSRPITGLAATARRRARTSTTRCFTRRAPKAAAHNDEKYWMPFFSPTGYGYRFDALANVLASLLQIAEPIPTGGGGYPYCSYHPAQFPETAPRLSSGDHPQGRGLGGAADDLFLYLQEQTLRISERRPMADDHRFLRGGSGRQGGNGKGRTVSRPPSIRPMPAKEKTANGSFRNSSTARPSKPVAPCFKAGARPRRSSAIMP